MGIALKIYKFRSDKVNRLITGAEFFNELIVPMMPWFKIRAKNVLDVSGGELVFDIGDVELRCQRDGEGYWISRAHIPGEGDSFYQKFYHVDRFCKVIDGFQRDDEGGLYRVAG